MSSLGLRTRPQPCVYDRFELLHHIQHQQSIKHRITKLQSHKNAYTQTINRIKFSDKRTVHKTSQNIAQ